MVKGKNTKLQKHYNDEKFRYSCPQCRNSPTQKRCYKTKSNRRGKRNIPVSKESHKRFKGGEMSSFSNSGEEESQKVNKNLDYSDDVNMAHDPSQMDEDLQELSCLSQSFIEKKAPSELDGDQFDNGEKLKGEETKIKESKGKKVLKRRKLKRTYEEYSNTDVKNYKDTIEEFTRYRSIKFSKENEDKVEARSLAMKVSLFCGLSQAQVNERIQQDIESISNSLNTNEKSESEVMSNSPLKESERDASNIRRENSFRNGSSVHAGFGELGFGKRLRKTRIQTSIGKHY